MKKFKAYLRRHNYSGASVQVFCDNVRLFLNWWQGEIHEVVYNDVIAYIKHCRDKGNKPATLNLAAKSLWHYFNHLGYAKNPAEHVHIKGGQRYTPHRILDRSTLRAMYENWPQDTATQIRNKCIVGLIVFQALRSGEVMALTTQDISINFGVVKVSSVQRSVARKLTLQPKQLPLLQQYITEIHPVFVQAKPQATGRLFLTWRNGLAPNALANTLHRISEKLKADYAEFTGFKQVRASVITHWLKTHNLRQVQQMAGHRYLSSTEQYRQNDMQELTRAIAVFHPDAGD